MDDIFQKALAGNKSAVKGVYACCAQSAYDAVFEALGDEEKAVETVKTAFVSAFSSAKTYDEFFALLNKRAQTSCRLSLGKNVQLKEISATQGVFTDIAALSLPEELKTFDETLVGALEHFLQPAEKAKGKRIKTHPAGKKQQKSELEQFADALADRDFSEFENVALPKEPEVQKPKSIAEKLYSEESVISDEVKTLEQIEKQKSKKASIIAFCFTAVILVGAIATYFITSRTEKAETTNFVNTAENAAAQADDKKDYAYKDIEQAYRDLLSQLIEEEKLVINQRIIAYDESADVGIDQLNGIVSAKVVDLDGDETPEFAVVKLDIEPKEVAYRYRYSLNLYRFVNGKVEIASRNHNLLEYTVYNRGGDYNMSDFYMYLKVVKQSKGSLLYAEAGSIGLRVCSFHRYVAGKMSEAERFIYYVPEENVGLLLQKHYDGTYLPLSLNVYSQDMTKIGSFKEDVTRALEDYGFHFGTSEVKYQGLENAMQYINMLVEKFGAKAYGHLYIKFAAEAEKTPDYICALKAVNEQGYMLSRREVVKVKDFTKISDFLNGESQTTTEPTTESTTIEIPTDPITTVAPSTEEADDGIDEEEVEEESAEAETLGEEYAGTEIVETP